MVIVELFALFLVIGVAACCPRRIRAAGRHVRGPLRRLANRRGLCIALTGLGVLAVEVGFGLWVHMPQPALHDEFSYLLAADTFAEGRLSNDTHPLWEHFESYGIIHQPSYQSKYPPGQGLSLALGQRLCGRPIVGVWITLALACAAVTWMAYGWLPPRWACLAGLLLACNGRLLRFWGATFMGGGVALLGGALVFGALPRMLRTGKATDSILFALGLGILANSRPYEGLVASLPVAIVLLAAGVQAWRGRIALSPLAWRRLVIAGSATLLAIGSWTAFYNYRVTGHPLRMPYVVWQETYTSDSLWDTLFREQEDRLPNEAPPRAIGNGPTQADWQMWFRQRSDVTTKLLSHWGLYVGVLLTPFLFALPWAWRQRRMQFALGVVALVLTAICLQNTHGHPHYAAPVAGLLFVLLAHGARMLSVWRWGDRPIGNALASLTVLVLCGGFAVYAVCDWAAAPVPPQLGWSLQRARLEAQLAAGPDRHLVIVRHPPATRTGIEWDQWVYNRADIDGAKTVWARDLGEPRNRRLLEYFAARRAWLLDLSNESLALRPLQPPANRVQLSMTPASLP